MYHTTEYSPHHTQYVDTDYMHDYMVDNSPYPFLNGYSLPAGGRRSSELLYGENLTDLCKDTRSNLHRLRETLANVDPCYQFGMDHWHFNKEKKECDVELPEHMRPKWANTNTMFTTRGVMNRTTWSSPHSGESQNDKPGPVNKYCYLCTTLEEHQQHLARRGRQLKAKEAPNPRVGFIVPVPKSRKKNETTDGVHDSLYRVTITTGNKPNAATSANVKIKLKGKEGTMKPQQLTKKTCVSFTFGRGTLETFYIKTPKLGRLRSLVISHDGLEKKHSWYLEEIEVFDVAAKQLYIFRCKQWLSLYEGDQRIKVELGAKAVEKVKEEYEIRVTTGNKTLAGTDANVTLTLCGKLAYSSKMKLRKDKRGGSTLERGKTDTFYMVTEDIGALQKIRIEHDNKGRSPDWFLEKIEVDGGSEGRPLLFPCGRWIPNDDEQERSKITLDLYPVRSLSGLKKLLRHDVSKKDDQIKGPQTLYHVTVITGDRWGAGTDANVYVMFFGKKVQSRDIQLDDEKNNFERGMVDKFKIKGEDVGPIKKIRLRHDNTSLAAGWFVEKVIVKRFFTEEERTERMMEEGMEEDEEALRRASAITGKEIRGKDLDRDEKKKKKKKSYSDDDSEDDSDDEYTKLRKREKLKEKERLKNRPASAKYGRKSRDDSDEEESENEKKKKKKAEKKKKFRLFGSSSDSDSDDKKKSKKKKDKKDLSDDDDSDYKKSKKKKDSKKKRFNFLDSSDSDDEKGKKKGKKKSALRGIKEESESDDNRKKKKKAGKKKFSYGGIDTWVTDSESDSDADKKSGKKGRKVDEVDGKRKGSKKVRYSDQNKQRSKYDDHSSSEDSSDSSSDSDSDSDGGKKKHRKKNSNIEKGRRVKGQISSDSEVEEEYKGRLYTNMGKGRIPLYDEYDFPCNRWFATDEDDGKIERFLKPSTITTFYRKV